MSNPSPETWLCPLCDHRCAYGKMGCVEPDTCELGKKNVHWYSRAKVKQEGKAVGIALISEEEQEK